MSLKCGLKPGLTLSMLLMLCSLRASFAEMPEPQLAPGKAVWEPINYPNDLAFADVFFIDASIGWIAGGNYSSGGFILHTTDGGTTWAVQAGDPEGADGRYWRLRFVDATHGWAIQPTGMAANLFATRDGQQWDLVGHVPEHFTDYQFVNPTDGFVLDGRRVLATHDGGSTWSELFTAATQVEVEGLTHSVTCELQSFSFSVSSRKHHTPLSGTPDSAPNRRSRPDRSTQAPANPPNQRSPLRDS